MQLSGECRTYKENPDWIKIKQLYESKSFNDDIISILNTPNVELYKNWTYILRDELQKYADNSATLLQKYTIDDEDNGIVLRCYMLPEPLTEYKIDIEI